MFRSSSGHPYGVLFQNKEVQNADELLRRSTFLILKNSGYY